MVTLIVPNGRKVQFTAGLLTPLGLDDSGWLDGGTNTGDLPVNFAPTKALHLERVNTTHNVLDGAPGTLLGLWVWDATHLVKLKLLLSSTKNSSALGVERWTN